MAFVPMQFHKSPHIRFFRGLDLNWMLYVSFLA
jgi:hypothetical protein